MITKFGSLYAGHVDLDNLGLDGTPVNDRWLSDDHLASVFDKSEAIVLAMERLGYALVSFPLNTIFNGKDTSVSPTCCCSSSIWPT